MLICGRGSVWKVIRAQQEANCLATALTLLSKDSPLHSVLPMFACTCSLTLRSPHP